MGGDPSSGGCGRVDSGDCSPTGPGPQDGAAMPAADGVEAVRAGGTVGDAADRARRVPAAPGVDGGLLGEVLFQELRRREYRGSYETVKRFVRPLREARLHAAVTRTRFETPPTAEPGRLGTGPHLVRPAAGGATHLRADARLLAPERLRALPERDTRPAARCARAGVFVLRRAHAGASLRPAADGL